LRWHLAAAAAALLTLAAAKPPEPKDPADVVRMSGEQQKTVQLQTARAERRPITEAVRVPGTVAFDQGHVAVLRSLSQARVVRLLVEPGDTVHAGQPLAELDSPGLADAQAGLATANATEREAAAGVAVARDSLRRGEILARDGSLARAETERRRLTLAQADAAVDSAHAHAAALQATVARLNPGSTPGLARLVAPIAGVVVVVGITPGEVADTTGGGLTVADLSVMLVLAQVPEASAPLIAVGDSARVRLTAGGGRVWSGKVVALGAALDTQARTLPARIQLDNSDRALRSGMTVDVTLTSDRERDDVVVPSGAVQMVGDKRVAFTRLDGDRFQSHDLTLGVERQDWVEVRQGLKAGDEVVTQGSFELKALLQKAMLGGAG